jgi:arylsulfatase
MVGLFLVGAFWLPVAAGSPESPLAPQTRKPNIVLVLADDMGFSDIGSYGGEIPTPHIDKLAENGLKFTQFYNSARCSPSRASLMTGLYQFQVGIATLAGATYAKNLPGYRAFLAGGVPTVADKLREAGYFTILSGKWHLGSKLNDVAKPMFRGFDRALYSEAGGYYGAKEGKDLRYWNGSIVPDDHESLCGDGGDNIGMSCWYTTDMLTRKGIEMVKSNPNKTMPFFLFLSQIAPHFPITAAPEDIAMFRGHYSKNWEVPAKARLKRQQALGLFSNNVVGAPPDERQKYSLLIDSNDVNWDTVDALDHQMAVYAAVVWRLDRSVGSLVDSLKEMGVFNDTLVMFLSDNGPEYQQGGIKGKTTGDPTVSGSFWSYARGWSSLSSAPFRKWKMKTHQGGIASPLIVHWPSGISRRGWVRGVHHIIDIFPTLLAVAGENPANFPQLEGASFFPSLVDSSYRAQHSATGTQCMSVYISNAWKYIHGRIMKRMCYACLRLSIFWLMVIVGGKELLRLVMGQLPA